MTPYIDIHSHRDGDRAAVTLRSYRIGVDDRIPPAPLSAGIHPWDAKTSATAEAIAYLRTANIEAIGEIGLDHAADVDRDKQIYVFTEQLLIASERGLPVIIHCVKAFEEVMQVLKKMSPLAGVIMHGYIGSEQQTKTALEMGAYLSVGRTSLGSQRTVRGIKASGTDRLFLETDDSGYSIGDVYRLASDVLEVEAEILKTITYNNYKTLFPR